MLKQLDVPVFVEVVHVPEHYNRTCGCTIPEYWNASVVSGIPEIDDPENYDYLERFGYPKFQVNVAGGSRREAIENLANTLRNDLGYTGTMRVITF